VLGIALAIWFVRSQLRRPRRIARRKLGRKKDRNAAVIEGSRNVKPPQSSTR
jgi:hypothetical protein